MTLALWRVGPLGTTHGLIREADGLHAACGKWNPEDHEAKREATAGTPRCSQCAMLLRYDGPAPATEDPAHRFFAANRIRELAKAEPHLTPAQIAERLKTTKDRVRYALTGRR